MDSRYGAERWCRHLQTSRQILNSIRCLNHQPVEVVTKSWNDTVTLPLLDNQARRGIQHRLKGTKVNGSGRGGVALLRKPAISLKRGKIGPKLLLMTNRKSHARCTLSVGLSNIDVSCQCIYSEIRMVLLRIQCHAGFILSNFCILFIACVSVRMCLFVSCVFIPRCRQCYTQRYVLLSYVVRPSLCDVDVR